MIKEFPPIVLFVYNRPLEFKKAFDSLLKCIGIENHKIIIFCDGPKNKLDKIKTDEVLEYLKSFEKENQFQFFSSPVNQGLAKSIINGITKVFQTYNQIIALEDDLIVSKNFLCFMNQALDYYKNDSKIFSISGYSPKIKFPLNYEEDYYFSPRGSSWGWGTWKNRWETVDWEVTSYSKFKYNFLEQYKFSRGGIDLPQMLKNQMNGKINSWAIRWVYQEFLNNQATVYPRISKVVSIGIGKNATHTKKTNRFETDLDTSEKQVFNFEKFNNYNNKILFSFRNVFSILKRILDKID